MAARALSLILLLVGLGAKADPLNGSLPAGVSTAHFYDAASVFTNPAALGFQTELNGLAVSSALFGAVGRRTDDAFSAALSLGYLGFGFERLVTPTGRRNRYHLAAGAALHPKLFVGARYSFGTAKSLDFGAQIRPSRYFALGLMANGVNAGTTWIAGLIVRPLPALSLTVDVDTPDSNFGSTFGYASTVGYELARGLQAHVGYHHLWGVGVGVRLDLGLNSIYATAQPNNHERTLVLGLNSSAILKPSVIDPPRAVKVTFDASLQEEPLEGSLFLPDRPSLWEKLETLDRAARDPAVDLVVVQVDDFPLGFGAALEVSEKLWAIRQAGKPIEAYLGNSGLREYLIAAPAQRVFLGAGTQIDFTGPKSASFYLKGTLDKIGVEGELFARGKYKSAPEMFTRKEGSPEAKEVTMELLTEADRLLSDALARYGRVPKAKWKTALETALFSSNEAKAFGLVDEIADFGGRRHHLERSYLVSESLDRYRDRLDLPGRIAVVHGDGSILKSRSLLASGGAMTPEGMRKKFQRAVGDPRTEAIVFRINSGGGEVAASYEIGAMVEEARKRKPVIVSMGDIAASGGYLIAAPGDRIFAHAGTLTGSIGVFTGKPNLAGLFKKIDLHTQILSLAPHADLLAFDRPFSAEGRKIMIRELDEYYGDFTKYVGRNRRLSADKVEAAAQGRVWSGRRARELGLVDENGGLEAAVQYAASKVGLGDAEVWEVASTRGILDFLEPGSFLSAQALLPAEARETLVWMASLKENPFLLLTPVKALE